MHFIHIPSLRKLRRGLAKTGLASLCLLTTLSAQAQESPELLWQRGIPTNSRSGTWTADDHVVTVNEFSGWTENNLGIVQTARLYAYRASDMHLLKTVPLHPLVSMPYYDGIDATGTPGNVTLAVCGYDASSQAIVLLLDGTYNIRQVITLGASSQFGLSSLRFSPDGRRLAIGYSNSNSSSGGLQTLVLDTTNRPSYVPIKQIPGWSPVFVADPGSTELFTWGYERVSGFNYSRTFRYVGFDPMAAGIFNEVSFGTLAAPKLGNIYHGISSATGLLVYSATGQQFSPPHWGTNIGNNYPQGYYAPVGRPITRLEGGDPNRENLFVGGQVYTGRFADSSTDAYGFVELIQPWKGAAANGQYPVQKLIRSEESRSLAIYDFAVSLDSRKVALIGRGTTVLGQVRPDRWFVDIRRVDDNVPQPTLDETGPFGPLGGTAISPDSQIIACGMATSGRIFLYRSSDATLIRTLEQGGEVTHLTFSPDGQYLLSCSDFGQGYGMWGQKSIKLWRVSDGSLVREFPAQFKKSAAFSPDGSMIAVDERAYSGFDNSSVLLKLYRVSDGSFVRGMKAAVHPQYKIEDIVFSPDGTRLATISYASGGAVVFDVATGNRALPSGNVTGSAVAISPDSKMLAEGLWGGGIPGNSFLHKGIIRLRNLATGAVLRQIETPTGFYIDNLAFLPGGQVLVSVQRDGRVCLWDTDNGALLRSYTRETIQASLNFGEFYQSLAVAPNGQFFAHGRADNVLTVARNPFFRVSASLALTAISDVTRSGNTITARITLKNNGKDTAENVLLRGARLGTVDTTSSLPLTVGDVPPGATISAVVTFPAAGNAAGSAPFLRLEGRFAGGQFTCSRRVILP